MLRNVFPVAGLMLAQLLVGIGVVDGQTTAAPTAAAPTTTAAADADKIDKEIRASADAFVAAFQKRDAAAIAAQWTTDGVYIDELGQRFAGREAIQGEYETLFKDCGDDLAMRIEIDSIRVINAHTAIEEGRSALLPQSPDDTRVMSRYTAVHVNQDGRWLTAEVRDSFVELLPDAGDLQDLGWLVGNWGSTKNDASVEIRCRWVENNRFLLRTDAVTESGTATVGGLEVIGVDPSTQRITSWYFTNDGGHAVGVWTPTGGSWAVESLGVMEDGTETAATYILSRSDDDSLVWRSVDRMLGDATLPDMPEVTLKRKQ
jgi:uncharacterized protein (TIGR02246 family)